MFCARLSPVYKSHRKKTNKKILKQKQNIKCVETKHKSKQSVITSVITSIIANKIGIITLCIIIDGTVDGGLEAESPNRSTHVPLQTSKTMACIYVSVKIFFVFVMTRCNR